jgi:hypothetical protein
VNIENIKNLIRFHYTDLLERELDELCLNYYLKLFKKYKILNLKKRIVKRLH